jgi:hypothetical protein
LSFKICETAVLELANSQHTPQFPYALMLLLPKHDENGFGMIELRYHQ